MRRLAWAALVVGALLMSSSNVRAADWQRVASWSGTGMRNTETFTITGTQWQVAWTAQMPDGVGLMGITVYRDTGERVGLAANQANQPDMSGQTIMRGAGNYYLAINSGAAQWAITIDELR